LRLDAHNSISLKDDVVDCLLENRKVGLCFQTRTYCRAIQNPISLGAGGTHRWPLTSVQNSELDTCLVRSNSHYSAKRIDLADKVPLSNTPDRWITGHLTQRLDAVSKQQCSAPHPRRGQGSFSAGVTAPHDDHVEALLIPHVPGPLEREEIIGDGALWDDQCFT